MAQTPYETLGVSKTATQDEIKNAYRAAAKKHHPDLNPGDQAAEKRFKEINRAYELVGTPESRAKYDRGEHDEQAAGAGPGPRAGRGPFYRETQSGGGGRYSDSFGGAGMDDEFLRSIFEQMGGGRASAGRHQGFTSGDFPGQDATYRMDISFRDAALGAEREITLPNGKRLRVKIPAGVDTGAKLRFAGLGEPGLGRGPAGDAYVELRVRPSGLFRRAGPASKDVEIELPVSLPEAILGAEVKVPTLDGSVMLKIPPGVSTGSRLRIAGKGIASGAKRGDQYVAIKLVAPPDPDPGFKQAVEAWSKRQSYDPRAGWAGRARDEGGQAA
jgi:DnaJ-class molecular chaperone